MKKILFAMLILGITIPTYGGVFRNVIKPVSKVVSFPFIHPKKSAKGIGHGAKMIAVGTKKVAD